MTRLPHLHHKTAKGNDYWYFDTGQRDADGKKIFSKMPHKRSAEFPRAYALACEQRKRRHSTAPIRTFDWLVKAYEKSPEFKLKSVNTQKSYALAFRKAAGFLRGFNDVSAPLDSITTADVLRIRDVLMDGKGANQTVRCLSALFTWASHKGRQYMPENPARDVELFEEGEHDAWPDWLVESALEAEEVRAWVGLLYFTGQRIGDVLKLRWSDIRSDCIELTQEKTGTKLRIPVAAELQTILETIPRRGLTIMAKSTGGRYSYNGVRPVLKGWIKQQGRDEKIHGLRKNAVNALLEAECSTAEVSAITGQSLKMVEHYAKQRNQAKLGETAIIKLDTARQKRSKART